LFRDQEAVGSNPETFEVSRNAILAKSRQAKPPEFMESLFRHLELFYDWMEAATKNIPLRQRLTSAIPKQETIFPVTDERLEHLRQCRAQMNISNGTLGFWCLNSVSPNGLPYIQDAEIRRDVLVDFESKSFTYSESTSRKQYVEHEFTIVPSRAAGRKRSRRRKIGHGAPAPPILRDRAG
jgi:hypothetical protein